MRLIEFFDRFNQGEEVFFRFTRTVADIMTESPVTLAPHDTLFRAIKVFETCGIRHLPIVEAPTVEGDPPVLSGLISHRDVSRATPPGLGTCVTIDETIETMLQEQLQSIMTENVQRVKVTAPIAELVGTMLSRGVDALPVVRDQTQLVGIVTTLDIIRCFQCLLFLRRLRQDLPGVGLGELPLSSFTTSPARDIMQPHASTADPNATVETVLELMKSSGTRRVFVTEESGENVIGVVSDRDLLHCLPPISKEGETDLFHLDSDEETAAVLRQKVFSIMTRPVTSIGPGTSTSDVIDLFCRHKFGAIPVVERKRLLGAVTQEDLLLEFLNACRADGAEADTCMGES